MWDLIVSVPDHCLSFYFPAIASGMDIVLPKVSVVVLKPFDTGTTRPISC